MPPGRGRPTLDTVCRLRVTAMAKQKEIALVTGGGAGIGLATVRRLAEDGFQVLAMGRSRNVTIECDKLRSEGLDVTAAVVDVTDRPKMVAALAPYPRLDVVVAAAGIAKVTPFVEIGDEEFNHILTVNLYGVFVTLQEGLRRMGEGGRIIALSSRGVLGDANVAHYCASKAGIVGLVRAVAFETRRRLIAVNAIAPGFIETAMLQALGPERLAASARLEPRGRAAHPSEIAHAIAFLASPRTTFITGQTFFVDGGKSLGGLTAPV